MNSSIVQLLASEKLNGDNYVTWKSNLNTILVVDNLRFVLTEECPQTPASNVNRTSRKAYDRWIKANEKVRVYILASMSDVLAKKHESLATTKERMDSLKGMFGQQEWSLRHEAFKYIYTKRMKEGTSVREHVLDMMMHFNIVDVNGGTINEANQVSFILESLPKSFIPFQTNASLNKIEFNLTAFLNEFQRFQNPTKEKKGKGKTPKQNKGKKTAEKGKCYHCGENGHWLRNCPKYLVQKKAEKEAQGKYDLLENSSWKRLSEAEITLNVGTGEMVSAKAVRDLKLFFNDRDIILKNVLIGRLVKSGLLSQLEDNSLPPCDSCFEGKMTKIINSIVAFLVLYVDDILLIGNDVGHLTDIKKWLATQFQMKDLGNAQYVLGIQIIRNRKNKTLAISQTSYINEMLLRYKMQNSKKGLLLYRYEIHLSKEQCPKTPQEAEDMSNIPYASAVGSLMYAMLCTRLNICYSVEIVSRYQSNPGRDHWITVKNILKYLRRTKDYMLVYGSKDLILTGYTNSDFQTDKDARKYTSGLVFTLNGGAVVWRNIK
ncbi:gag/pol protein [Cucumis melo var. makuwa]|uniref:Gag/pol protein n=1 Tax=Cucumis melo var. makuwa TaxID=1194695 RepID=A0A5A7VF40_CUCMM|nr:gag/pol protein [Cucumis melo var. makuwa]